MGGKRILVVDDEPMVRLAIRITLQPDGHSIDLATSPDEALAKLEGGNYDVILTDFKMEGMTGLELAERIKARNPAQPIILVSGSPPFPTTSAVDLVILKPFSTWELRKAVTQLAERKG